ncbi:hypothetical protein Fot_42889 [Forsythia ovata]|uniref:Uncharacterized protein n=1 Tax=Forsythia ovata TaxID=205694 RepID=A0ABD1RMH8_9LAMI
MSSEHNDFQNQPAVKINPEIMVISPGKRCKGDSSVNWLIGSSIQLKCPMREWNESQGLEDQNSTIVNHGWFSLLKIHVFKIRCGRVVNERGALPSRLLIQSTVPILASAVSLVVEVVGSVSSSLPIPGTTSVPTATVLPMIEVVGGDSSSFLFEESVRPLEDVDHQGKEK